MAKELDHSKTVTCRARFLFVLAGMLGAVVDDAPAKKDESWLDELEAPAGDGLISSLRLIFTITYGHDLTDGAEERMLSKIRSLATESLRPFDSMLQALRLKPIGKDDEGKRSRAQIFKYVVAPASALRRKVLDEESGKQARFIDLVETAPVDPVLVALRKILSETFEEVFTRRERRRSLWKIRHLAAAALVPLNSILEEIELEPVAMPTREFDAEVDQEDAPEDNGG